MRRVRDEGGAAAIIVGVCATVLFGASAIVIDAGDIWQERRQLVSATDAAALAAAQDEAFGVDGCATRAGAYLEDNSPGSSMTDCTTTGTSSAGSITIDAEIVVTHSIAQILGRSDTTVTGASTAKWGMPTGLSGLRPFALCAESPGMQAWQASGHSTTQVFRIMYTKDQPDNCGGPAPGNWGLIDFDGGSNSNNDTKEWVEFGYPGVVTAPGWYYGDPGAFSNSLPMSTIVGEIIQLPVFDSFNGQGGANAQFYIVGFVSVYVAGYKSNGSQSSRYIDLQFQTSIVHGSCCTGGGIDTGLRVISLCAVEASSSC